MKYKKNVFRRIDLNPSGCKVFTYLEKRQLLSMQNGNFVCTADEVHMFFSDPNQLTTQSNSNIFLSLIYYIGGIQQLRGQEEGEGGSAKSPHLSTQGHSVTFWS